MLRPILIGILLVFSALFYRYGWTDSELAHASAEQSAAASHADVTHQSANSPLQSLFNSSVFAVPDQGDLIRKRKERMAKDGCLTPDRYFTMTVKELTELGNGGDALASIQLAERYWSEPASLVYDADMDFSESPRAIALRYYVMATRGGAGNIPAMVAKRLADTEDMAEAAAWDIVAQRFPRDGRLSGKEPSFKAMTYEQLNVAQQRAEHIATEMGTAL